MKTLKFASKRVCDLVYPVSSSDWGWVAANLAEYLQDWRSGTAFWSLFLHVAFKDRHVIMATNLTPFCNFIKCILKLWYTPEVVKLWVATQTWVARALSLGRRPFCDPTQFEGKKHKQLTIANKPQQNIFLLSGLACVVNIRLFKRI